MSSLAVSLVLLLVVAIALVLLYNLRQSSHSQWVAGARRFFDERLRGLGRASKEGSSPARSSHAVRNGARAGERGEPRLAEPGAAGTAARASAAAPVEFDEDDGFDEARHGGSDEYLSDDGATLPDADTIGTNPASSAGHADAAARPPATPSASPSYATSRPSAYSPSPSHSPPSASEPARAPISHPSSSARPSSPSAARTDSRASATAASASSGSAGAQARNEEGPAAVPGIAPSMAAAVSTPSSTTPSSTLSEVCDCIVELRLAASWSGERLIPLTQRFRRAGSKPVVIEGIATDDVNAQDWHTPVGGREYEWLRAGILLANRHGPLNAMEFSEFVSGVQDLAETLAADVTMPAMGPVLARARDLDATCAQLDAQIGVNVDATEAIEPAQLAAIAPALSIVERGSHRYVRPGTQGEALFSVSFADAPNRITFLLDVPRSSPALEPWAQMIECASDCARRLGAQLADDGGRALTQPALAQIARQLGQRYESLDAIGLPAGSPLALKVFN